jgi:hypothetical protein
VEKTTTMRDDLVTVATFDESVEANLARNQLASGLLAFLANERTVNMFWYWGNALGWIKLQVANADVEPALAELSRRDPVVTGSELETPASSESIPKEGFTEPYDDDEEVDDLDHTRSVRDRNAERAARGTVLGLVVAILLLPFELYAFYLLLKVLISREPLGDRERNTAIVAAVINVPIILSIGLYVWMILGSL